MKKITISLFLVLGIYTNANAGDCNRVVLNDNFSSSANWQSQGNGAVNISNGLCNFTNVYAGNYNRVYRDLGVTLSDTYWKGECDFNILSTNPYGNGSDATVMALTAGSLNFMSDGGVESNQDGIAVTFGSASPTDNNINNWYFCIQEKKGNIRNASTNIFASASVAHYYVRLERATQGTAKLSVFSDSTFTTHLPGSPVTFSITSTITGLNIIQHGVNAGGNPNRLINASIDNDLICDNIIINECENIILNDDFLSSANWQSQGNGAVNISNGLCNFTNVYAGNYNRVYRDLGVTLSDIYWKGECDFKILSTNPSGNGSDATVMALTAGNLNFMSDGGVESNQDGIAVTFGSASPTDNNINNWYFCIQEKKDNIRTASTNIFASASVAYYYVRLERATQGTAKLSVFSDSTFTTHLPGSPVTFPITSTITGLNTIQHGVNAGGNPNRLINASIDNDLICQKSNSGIMNYLQENTAISVYPNPVSDYLMIYYNNYIMTNYNLTLKNIQGQTVLSKAIEFFNTFNLNISDYSNGIYFLMLQNSKEQFIQKIMIQKQ